MNNPKNIAIAEAVRAASDRLIEKILAGEIDSEKAAKHALEPLGEILERLYREET